MPTESKRKRTKVAGRKKGTPNKLSADAKENIIAVFTRLNGTAGMAAWARRNKTAFYRIYAKLLPLTLEGGDKPITLVFDDPTQAPDGYHRKQVQPG